VHSITVKWIPLLIVHFFSKPAPADGTYECIEYGYYFSDWSNNHGDSGVSRSCEKMSVQITLPINIDIDIESVSIADWKGKLGALPAIDHTGLLISRKPISSEMESEIGMQWGITFLKQPGFVHNICWLSASGDTKCSVLSIQNASLIGDSFQISTTWPH
jgi:hypothetical protein